MHLLAYGDNIDIIGRTKRHVAAAFSAIEVESIKMHLTIIKNKKIYFDIGNEFIHFVTKNYFRIKRRISVANWCLYGLKTRLSSRGLSYTTRLILYKTLNFLVILYGADA